MNAKPKTVSEPVIVRLRGEDIAMVRYIAQQSKTTVGAVVRRLVAEALGGEA